MHIAVYAESEAGPVWVKATANPRATLRALQADRPALRLMCSSKVGAQAVRSVLAWLAVDWRHLSRSGRFVAIRPAAAHAAIRNAIHAVQSMPKSTVTAILRF